MTLAVARVNKRRRFAAEIKTVAMGRGKVATAKQQIRIGRLVGRRFLESPVFSCENSRRRFAAATLTVAMSEAPPLLRGAIPTLRDDKRQRPRETTSSRRVRSETPLKSRRPTYYFRFLSVFETGACGNRRRVAVG